MRGNELLKASLTTYALLVAKFIPLILILPVVLNNYSNQDSAIWLSFGSFFVVQNLIISGFGGALVRSLMISNKISKEATLSVRVIAFKIYTVITILTSVISAIYATSILRAVFESIWDLKYIFLFITIIVMFSISNGMGNYNQSILFSRKKLPQTRIIDTLIHLVILFIDYYFILRSANLLLILSIHLFILSLRFPILYVYRIGYTGFRLNRSKIDTQAGKEIFIDSALKTAASSVMASFSIQIFNLMLLWNFALSEVNVILYCLSLVTQLDSVSRTPFYSASPALTRRYLDNSADLNKGIYVVTMEVLALSIIGFSILNFDTIRGFIPFIVDAKFSKKIFTLLFVTEGFYRLAGMKLQLQSFSNDVKFHITAIAKLLFFIIMLFVLHNFHMEVNSLLWILLSFSFLISVLSSYYLLTTFKHRIHYSYYFLECIIILLILF